MSAIEIRRREGAEKPAEFFFPNKTRIENVLVFQVAQPPFAGLGLFLKNAWRPPGVVDPPTRTPQSSLQLAATFALANEDHRTQLVEGRSTGWKGSL
jgi:hypothetical protein